VRFVEQEVFTLRGVVAPVAERVFDQMKAVHVLGVSRAMARGAAAGKQQSETSLASLREYASLLGEEQAQEEVFGMEARIAAMQSAPSTAKDMVSEAHAKVRSARDFKK
jgi:hypothetical protein